MIETSTPSVSIVLPCRNEHGYIEQCLASILRQEPPSGGFEVVIADGMSTDGTREFLDQAARSHSQVRVLENRGRIVSTGLNAAIRAARGEVIVRMDAHTTYAPDYVRQCLAVLNETGAENVGGPMATTAATYTERAVQAAFHSAFAVGGARSHRVDYNGYVDTVIYGCWRRETLLRIGGFDDDLVRNQDDELNFRLTRAGGRIYQSTRIRSSYHVRGSLGALFRQYAQYGYWKVLVIRKHRLPASWRHLAPGAFFGVIMLSAVVGFAWRPAWWASFALAGGYAVALLASALLTAARTEWALLPLLPAALACFHVGYGYGFLRGVLDFVIRRRRPATQFAELTRGGRMGNAP